MHHISNRSNLKPIFFQDLSAFCYILHKRVNQCTFHHCGLCKLYLAVGIYLALFILLYLTIIVFEDLFIMCPRFIRFYDFIQILWIFFVIYQGIKWLRDPLLYIFSSLTQGFLKLRNWIWNFLHFFSILVMTTIFFIMDYAIENQMC